MAQVVTCILPGLCLSLLNYSHHLRWQEIPVAVLLPGNPWSLENLLFRLQLPRGV